MVLRQTLTDSRFSIRLEFCGYVNARYVLRFCGEWVSCHVTRDEAETARTAAITAHNAELTKGA